MILKTVCKKLAPGMYVVDTGLSWMDHPYLYAKQGEVESEDQVEAIIEEGFREVFVDTERGSFKWPVHMRERSVEQFVEASGLETEGGPAPSGPMPEMAAALREAEEFYTESLAFARNFTDSLVRGEQVDYERSVDFVDGIIDNVTRNPDALISLTKLRAFDEYTYTHCINVTVLATAFGNYLKLPEKRLKMLSLAALFHDIGKSRIPNEILNKPGRLTENEFGIMKQHSVRSYELLRLNDVISHSILRGVVDHHEKYDGSGYPRGISGDDLHPLARIVAVADVYDALTSSRVYKAGMPAAKAMSILFSMRNKDFYPGMADHFIRCIGVYPVGSFVRLSTGEYGVVCGANASAPLKPQIKIILSAQQKPTFQQIVDLATPEPGAESVKIESSEIPEEFGIDPAIYLM